MRKDLRASNVWLNRANGALQGTEKLDFVRFKDLLDDGEKMKVDQAILKKMRQQINLARKWRVKVKKTGLESGDATVAQLRALIPEAKGILVDLSEDMQVIKLATSKYCICRRGTPEGLITCIECKAPYHAACLDLVMSSADTFRCARCTIRRSYAESAQSVIDRPDQWTSIADPSPPFLGVALAQSSSNAPPDSGLSSHSIADVSVTVAGEIMPSPLASPPATEPSVDDSISTQAAMPGTSIVVDALTEEAPPPAAGSGYSAANQPTVESMPAAPANMQGADGLNDARSKLLEIAKKAIYSETSPPQSGGIPQSFRQVRQLAETYGIDTVADVQ
jgi:hypothetical protein